MSVQAIVLVPRLFLNVWVQKMNEFHFNSLDHRQGAPPCTGAEHPRCFAAVGQLPAERSVVLIGRTQEEICVTV